MFSNTEDGRKPQKLHIRWELETPTDETMDSPEERDEGFWPSLDPNSPGYIGENPETSYLEQLKEARLRMDHFNANDWEYVGVIAVANLLIPIGGESFRIMTLRSAGLWGIESDEDDYIREVFAEQRDSLLGELKSLCEALASGDYIEEGDFQKGGGESAV